MLVLIGLGNPGEQYTETRHNVGFQVIDAIAQLWNISSFKSGFQSLYADFQYKSNRSAEKILLVKPQTYMNLSGQAALAIKQFYKLSGEDFVVFYDDIYLPLGQLRYKTLSSSAGHNGIKSLQKSIGNSFSRVKIGVDGPPTPEYPLDKYVLGRFSNQQQKVIAALLNAITQNLDALIKQDFTSFIQKVSAA